MHRHSTDPHIEVMGYENVKKEGVKGLFFRRLVSNGDGGGRARVGCLFLLIFFKEGFHTVLWCSVVYSFLFLISSLLRNLHSATGSHDAPSKP